MDPTPGKTVLCLTGDPLVKLGLETLLKAEGLNLAPAAPSPDALFQHWTTPLDGIILDYGDPAPAEVRSSGRMNITCFVNEVKEAWPHCGVVIRADHIEAFVPLAMMINANGMTGIALISSHADLSDLHRAIRHAMSGHIFLQFTTGQCAPPMGMLVAQPMPDDLTMAVRGVGERLHHLSPQEEAVARRLYQDAKSIAQALGLSRRTVYHYMDSAYTKLGLKDSHGSPRHLHRSTLVFLAFLLSDNDGIRLGDSQTPL